MTDPISKPSLPTPASSADQPAHDKPKRKSSTLLRIIGVFKLIKSVGSLAACIVAIHLRNVPIDNVVFTLASWFHIAPGNRHLQRLLDKMLSVTHREWEVIAGIFAAYAVLFMIEGIGLVLMYYWAEWMTVITTSLLIPLELYEVFHHFGPGKLITLVINVAVVVYLVVRLRSELKSGVHDPHR